MRDAHDTIAAIATATGPSGVGVIRVSGPASIAILEAVFRPKLPVAIESHRLVFGIVAGLDEGYAVLFRAPRSFTGEDVVELQVHGGELNLRAILRAVCEAGARVARPGEFSERAFWNGKIDLPRAEALADLVTAEGEAALAIARAGCEGALSMAVRSLRDALLGELARIEVALDRDPDEAVSAFERARTARVLADVFARTVRLAETHGAGRLAREGVRLAIVGRPNVGKSSLMNALLGDDRALVDEAPGTTRDFIEDQIEVDGIRVTLIDTAGIRDATDSVEARGISLTRREIANADLVLWVVDGSEPWTNHDALVREFLGERPAIAALNKSDRPRLVELPAAIEATLAVSARTGDGIDRLRGVLAERFAARVSAATDLGGGRAVVTRERHRDALQRAAAAMGRARDGLIDVLPEECVASELQAALDALGTITGESAPEDLVERIFRDFCVGK